MIGRLKFNIDNIVMDIIKKIPDSVWDNPNATFLDPAMGGGQFVKAIEQKLRERGYSDESIRNRVFGLESNIMRINFAVNKYKLVGNYSVADFLNWETSMKFNVILGNPPYQTETDGNSRPIWHMFVEKSFEILNDGGYLALIHPSGWRNVDGRFTDIRDLLLSKQMEYLEIHNEKDGLQTFGAKTRYDWYVVENVDRSKKKTLVKFEDGSVRKVKLTELPFIPNHSYDKIASLIASPDEETVKILANSSYHTQRPHVSKEKTKKFKYPVVYSVNRSNEPNLMWSSRNDLGHFGYPKLIGMPATGTGFYLDETGEYAMTQFAYAIVDTVPNLKKIEKVMHNLDFLQWMESSTSLGTNGINYKILSTLRKDFWKEFV